MLLSSFLGWWYLSGWAWLASEIKNRIRAINEIFSVQILLKTLFSPWKQIRTPSSFHNFFQAAIDNLVSRFIGAIVRLGMLVFAILCLVIVVTLGLIFTVLWPIIPPLMIILPLLSITGTELW